MKNRIAQLIASEGLTSSKFADTIGVQRSSISHILSGRNNPSLDFIQKILNAYPSVNLDWLIAGDGDMYKSDDSPTLFAPSGATEEDQEVTQPPKLKKETQISSQTPIPDPIMEMNPFVPGKQIEKVVVFYTDKTFREYNPS
ncbi:MAG: helix-turn-helix transcriptional regulator [Marinifilaceae bacterium]